MLKPLEYLESLFQYIYGRRSARRDSTVAPVATVLFVQLRLSLVHQHLQLYGEIIEQPSQ
jgi:hypothetical protein